MAGRPPLISLPSPARNGFLLRHHDVYKVVPPRFIFSDPLQSLGDDEIPPPLACVLFSDPVYCYLCFPQCGGDDYDGSTCCRVGYECQDVADCYSEVRLRKAARARRFLRLR